MTEMSTSGVNPVLPAEPTSSPADAWPPVGEKSDRASGPAPAGFQADLRLVIEEDKAAGSYVYKTVDVRTGKVVQQIPREEVLRLRDAEAYEPGAVISARG
jgi:flagellar protein FlaG